MKNMRRSLEEVIGTSKGGPKSLGIRLLRVLVLSSILFVASSASLSAQQDTPPQPQAGGVIVQDEYVLVPKTTMMQWQLDVVQLLTYKDAIEKQLKEAKEFLDTGKSCS